MEWIGAGIAFAGFWVGVGLANLGRELAKAMLTWARVTTNEEEN